MDVLKTSYEECSSDESSAGENETITDYLGLTHSELDVELDRDVEKRVAEAQQYEQTIKDAFFLNSTVLGPHKFDNPTQTLPQKKRFKIFHKSEAESPISNVEDKTISLCTDKDLRSSNGNCISWENTIRTLSESEKQCYAPTRCTVTNRVSEKTLSTVQWNKSFNHLLLIASLDGAALIWDFLKRKITASFPLHANGIKAGVWSLDGRKIFTGGFDKSARLTDVDTGQEILSFKHTKLVSSVQRHPVDTNVFLSGSFNCMQAWDDRKGAKPIRTFSANCKQVLCLTFLPGDEEFVCSTEVVSQDSADRTIMAWHFPSGAIFSNQIYQERYTCPWLCVDTSRNNFLAQSSGNYIAEFSVVRPYKMNKYRRYEGHQLSGYAICFCLSKDCTYLATGESSGSVCIYKVDSTHLVRRLSPLNNNNNNSPTISVDWHPQLPSVLASGSWDGHLQFWT